MTLPLSSLFVRSNSLTSSSIQNMRLLLSIFPARYISRVVFPLPVSPVIQIDTPYLVRIDKVSSISSVAVPLVIKSVPLNCLGFMIRNEALTPAPLSITPSPKTVSLILLCKCPRTIGLDRSKIRVLSCFNILFITSSACSGLLKVSG